MKLLVQSDDYGITRAQAAGCIYAIEHGIVRNTGIFMNNMPWTEEICEWIKPYIDKISLGMDCNLSTGWPLLSPEQIPHCVQPNGKYLTSSMNRELDKTAPNHDHFVYEEAFAEYEAQVQRYIKVFGRKPAYLQGHVYTTPTLEQVQIDLAAKYNIPYCHNVRRDFDKMNAAYVPVDSNSWYQGRSLDDQNNSSLKEFLLQDKGHLLDKDYAMVTCHVGYVDKELMELSTFNVFRVRDLEAVTCDEIKQWVKDNNIELITYADLKY